MGFIALCADEESLKCPESLGLDGECFDRLAWLKTYSEACSARQALAFSHDVDEVWVASCDSVDPINLAATLKRDVPTRKVFLVSSEQSGSLMSRAHSANIDDVLTRAEFVGRYLSKKQLARKSQKACKPAHARIEEGDKLVGPVFSQSPKAGMSLTEQAEAIVRHRIDTTGFNGPVLERESPLQASSAACADRDSENVIVVEAHDEGREAVRGAHAAKAAKVLRAEGREAAVSAENAFLLPVVSGSGGSGKSAVAALAAIAMQQAGLKTMLIDLDLQFGDMKEMLGVEEALHVEDLIETPIRLKHLSSEGSKPALLTIPRNLEQSEGVIKRLPELLDLVRPNYDAVVVNTGSFWSDEHAILLEQCSRALFMVDQRPSSLRACQRALDLCTRCGIATSPLVFVVNKCSKSGMYSSIDVSCALHGAMSKELMWGGSVVEEYLAAGQASELLEMRNAFVVSLCVLLGEIVPAMPQAEADRPAHGRSPLLRLFGIE